MILPGPGNHHGGISGDGEQLDEGEVLYACPACGVVVSNHDSAAMRLHHLHVIQPAHQDRTVEHFRERMDAQHAQDARHRDRHALLAEDAGAGPGDR